jgi:hypothetical protein
MDVEPVEAYNSPPEPVLPPRLAPSTPEPAPQPPPVASAPPERGESRLPPPSAPVPADSAQNVDLFA